MPENINIQKKFAAIKASYIESFKDKHNSITETWELLQEEWDDTTYQGLYHILHGLAGSAETFGFPELTLQARATLDTLKACLEKSGKIQAIDIPRLNEMIQVLLTIISNHSKINN